MKVVMFCGIIIIAIFILNVNAAGSEPNGGKKSPPSQAGQTGTGGRKRPPQKKMVRVPITNVPVSPQLIAINKRLTMDGKKKDLTKKQAAWIERFVTSIKNWLYVVDNIIKTKKFKQIYTNHLKSEFDMWITGRKDQPFDMIYRNENDHTEPPIHYKLIIYRISLADIALVENFNVKSLEIGFERSNEKMTTPNGEQVYRKDRVYVMEVEAELPLLDVKFRHEIVQGKEEGDFDPLKLEKEQDVKPGYLRMRMSNVKIYIKVFLTEIDKRFVYEDPETKETYYFKKPEILDFRFSIGEAELFEPEFQKKPNLPEDLVGENLPKKRADKILKDFAHFLILNENEKEFNYRLKMALMNRYSRALMLSNDVLLFGANLDQETAFYIPDLPFTIDDSDREFGYKILYMSYSLESFLNTCKHFFFKALEYQSNMRSTQTGDSKLTPEQLEEKAKKEKENEEKLEALGNEAEKWMEDQATKASNGLSVADDGFDWDEDK